MTTISLKQLHDETGAWIRQAAQRPIDVTNHGEVIATLTPYVPHSLESHAKVLKQAAVRLRRTKK